MNFLVVGPKMVMLAASLGLDTVHGASDIHPTDGDVGNEFRDAPDGPGKSRA